MINDTVSASAAESCRTPELPPAKAFTQDQWREIAGEWARRAQYWFDKYAEACIRMVEARDDDES